jgi:hypothetical protein
MVYKFKVEGIDCPMCALSLASNLRKQIDGVVNVNMFSHILIIETWLLKGEVEVVLQRNTKSYHATIQYIELKE